MRIIVCVKQVPGASRVEIDEATGVLKRSGVDAKTNPYDLYAIETALMLRQRFGGTVTVISMGPHQAEEVIREGLALGADGGVLMSDLAFAGADVLATARTLAAGIASLGGFDIIICGKQTTDGDTAQAGPEIAEFLDIPHISNVTAVHDAANNALRISSDMEDATAVWDMDMPCLITVEKDIYVPRLPSYKLSLTTRDKPIGRLTLKDLPGANPKDFGLNGSPTRVERIYPPETTTRRIYIDGEPEIAAETLYDKLTELKLI